MTRDYLGDAERRMAQGDPIEQAFERQAKRLFDPKVDAMAVIETQAAILRYAEPMAQFMAAAAIASEKATGDHAIVAMQKWMRVIEQRTREIIREKSGTQDAGQKRLELHPRTDPEKQD